MSTWVAPLTFTATNVLTAANLNAGRDNLNFLKGAFDQLTASTVADTGDTMQIRFSRPTAASNAIATDVTGDSQRRFQMTTDGKMGWGSGAAVADVLLYRASATVLQTDAFLAVGTSITFGSGMLFLTEIAAPGAAAANSCRIFAVDVAGKTRLSVQFPSGAAQTIATEP